MTQEEKLLLEQLVRQQSGTIHQLNKEIWEAAELGFQEIKSVAAFREKALANGFEWTDGLAGIPTAFCASYGSEGPTIGILAEFDALPELGQVCGALTRTPIGNTGHGCGHNMLGAAAFGAALAVKNFLEKNGKKGRVQLFGCPAEESGCGKTFMTRDHCFDHLDAALCWHPDDSNMVLGISTLANVHVKFNFSGVLAHAAAVPELGRSALDAAELMNVGVQFLREHVTSDVRIHYAFLDAGGQAPNVVQASSSLLYYIRASKASQVRDIYARIEDIARGAALMTGTKVTWQIVAGLSDYIPNKSISILMQECFDEVGAPKFDQKDYETAKKFFYETYSDEMIKANQKKLIDRFGPELGAKMAKDPLCTEIRPLVFQDKVLPGSTDVGDVSYVTPTAQMGCACYALCTAAHTWQVTAQGDLPAAHKAVDTVSHVLALTALRAMESPELLAQAKQELQAATGGEYVCPIPAEIKPAIGEAC